jgi:hypothetical protein
MNWGAVLVVLGLTVLVAVFLARPLIRQEAVAITEDERRISALRAEEDRLLALIQDLDADHLMSKISCADYTAQRQPLLLRAADILRQIDVLPPGARGSGAATALDDEIEEAVRRLRGEGKAGGVCARCGEALQAGDRFCSRCGAEVPRGTSGT